ncbi:MAG: tRNA (N6-isopentenyl adenosine(37)-C2)-methylthiotransferase MiaB [Clostridia bacterium]|nr:tRNA (N6-isopentenyl adenosine(37)-C2)-methylthiotransferase MiaB [Clostridia bacterium]
MSDRKSSVIAPEEIQKQNDIIAAIRRFMIQNGFSKKAFVETYGCQQNVNDSEVLCGMLEQMGYTMTDDRAEADFILYNTCAVREGAELKVFGNLGALKHLKTKKPDLIIGVCGCMMQQEQVQKEVKSKYKHVSVVFGTHSLYRFPEILQKALMENTRVFDIVEDGAVYEGLPISRKEGPCAWVSVMYGCNNFCTYCIVPHVRGRERSRDKNIILEEIKALAKEGYKEITLLGQNVNSYGNDLEENIDFADLLTMVHEVEGIERIRFMTSHPKDISDKLIETMARLPKVCKQLHLPVQAGNNEVLRAMNRRYTKEDYLEKIKKVRALMPDIVLTSDIIVGFPCETNEQFEDTIDVLQKVRYDTIFSFIYSRRPGTPAAKMEDAATVEDRKKNFNRLLEVQDAISKEINDSYVGRIEKVLVEGASKTNPDTMTGRTDGGKIVNFEGDSTMVGKIIDIEITESRTWSLVGKII